MKNVLIKIVSAVILCGAILLVAPKTEVKAYTCFGDMTYDEVCNYWSAQPLWKQMFDLESAKSGYLDNAKADLLTYFKVSLNDYVWKPDVVIASRPLTANYLRDVLAFSNPNIVNVIRGCQGASSLTDVLRSEVRSAAPCLCDGDVNSCADELRGCLSGHGVDTVSKYDDWKRCHGCSAFAYFMGNSYRGFCRYECSPCGWGYRGWDRCGWYAYAWNCCGLNPCDYGCNVHAYVACETASNLIDVAQETVAYQEDCINATIEAATANYEKMVNMTSVSFQFP